MGSPAPECLIVSPHMTQVEGFNPDRVFQASGATLGSVLRDHGGTGVTSISAAAVTGSGGLGGPDGPMYTLAWPKHTSHPRTPPSLAVWLQEGSYRPLSKLPDAPPGKAWWFGAHVREQPELIVWLFSDALGQWGWSMVDGISSLNV